MLFRSVDTTPNDQHYNPVHSLSGATDEEQALIKTLFKSYFAEDAGDPTAAHDTVRDLALAIGRMKYKVPQDQELTAAQIKLITENKDISRSEWTIYNIKIAKKEKEALQYVRDHEIKACHHGGNR